MSSETPPARYPQPWDRTSPRQIGLDSGWERHPVTAAEFYQSLTFAQQTALSHVIDMYRADTRDSAQKLLAQLRRRYDCCQLHNQHCEPPSELCCDRCTEISHPHHRDGTTCVLPADLSPLGAPTQ